MKDLGRRTVVSLISISAATLLVFFSYNNLVKPLLLAVLAILSSVATWEYVQFTISKSPLTVSKGGKLLLSHLIVFAALLTLSFAFSEIGTLLVFLIALLTLFGLHFKSCDGALVDLALSTFPLVYIAIPMGMILSILYFPGQGDGRIWIAYLIAVTKVTDMGAYFGGQLFGKKKLAREISPSKTVEGAIAGLIVAVSVSLLFFAFGFITLFEAIALGILLGGMGQFGDLAESLLKRDAKKKDSNTLPGLGGVLDMVDSLLFNGPILFCYLSVVS